MEITSDILRSRLGVIRTDRSSLVSDSSQFGISFTLGFPLFLASTLCPKNGFTRRPLPFSSEVALSLAFGDGRGLGLGDRILDLKDLQLNFLGLMRHLRCLMSRQEVRGEPRDVSIMADLPASQSK